MTKNIKLLLLASLSFMACDNLGDETAESSGYNTSDGNAPTAGTADFSKYVALGDSFAAGYSDSSLFIEGQKGAYPNLLAQQFATVGGGDFATPFMNDNIGGFSNGGVQSTSYGVRLYFGKLTGSDYDEPLKVSGTSSTDINTHLTGTYNNLGVPGAKCIHLVTPGYGYNSTLGNPYFARFASTPTTTVLADALNQSPTFFSLWIGGNDVLGYALAGGDASINPLTPSAGPVGVGFDASYNEIINQLTTGDRKGVIANLPYVTTLPQFSYLKPNFIEPYNYFVDGDEKKKTRVVSSGDVATINTLNSILGFLDQVLTAYGEGNRINILSTTTANPVLLKDETLTDYGPQISGAATASGNPQLMAFASYLGATFGKVRQTTTGDLIPLTTSSAIGTLATVPTGVPSTFAAYGISYPLEDRHILIPTEIAEIKTATDAYNTTILAAATSKGLAFVDAKSFMDQLSTTGYTANNYTVKSDFATGGAFSLDGIHPSPRGYALIANLFSQAINAKYGSNFGNLNLGNYRILFPQSL